MKLAIALKIYLLRLPFLSAIPNLELGFDFRNTGLSFRPYGAFQEKNKALLLKTIVAS